MDSLLEVYPLLEGVIDSSSDHAKQLYCLLSYYTDPVCFNYNTPSSYPHMEILTVNLMFPTNYYWHDSFVNVLEDRENAFNRLIEWSDNNISDYGVYWNSAEAAYTILAIDTFLNQNSILDTTIDCSSTMMPINPNTGFHVHVLLFITILILVFLFLIMRFQSLKSVFQTYLKF